MLVVAVALAAGRWCCGGSEPSSRRSPQRAAWEWRVCPPRWGSSPFGGRGAWVWVAEVLGTALEMRARPPCSGRSPGRGRRSTRHAGPRWRTPRSAQSSARGGGSLSRVERDDRPRAAGDPPARDAKSDSLRRRWGRGSIARVDAGSTFVHNRLWSRLCSGGRFGLQPGAGGRFARRSWGGECR